MSLDINTGYNLKRNQNTLRQTLLIYNFRPNVYTTRGLTKKVQQYFRLIERWRLVFSLFIEFKLYTSVLKSRFSVFIPDDKHITQ